MDTKTLLHVGVEVVVIGGITFYFQRKISILQGENQLLRDDLTKTQQKLDEVIKIMNIYDQILFPGKYGNPENRPIQRQPHPQHPSQPHPHPHQHPSQPSSKVHPDQSSEESEIKEEEEIPDEELDALLGEELSNLKEKKQEFIEIECTEDSCDTLNTGKRKKKVLNPETSP